MGKMESGVTSNTSLLGLPMHSPFLKQKQGMSALLRFPRGTEVWNEPCSR